MQPGSVVVDVAVDMYPAGVTGDRGYLLAAGPEVAEAAGPAVVEEAGQVAAVVLADSVAEVVVAVAPVEVGSINNRRVG